MQKLIFVDDDQYSDTNLNYLMIDVHKFAWNENLFHTIFTEQMELSTIYLQCYQMVRLLANSAHFLSPTNNLKMANYQPVN